MYGLDCTGLTALKKQIYQLFAQRPLQWLICLVSGVGLGFGISSALTQAPVEDEGEPLVVNPFASCPEKLSAVERERRVLREELAYTKQSVLIEQEACFELRNSLSQQQDELSKLNEQLAFYRGIVSPEQNEAGLRIHNLELFDQGYQVVQFRLTMVQPVRQNQEAKGRLELVIEGLQEEAFRSLSLNDLALADSFSTAYAFRYYAELHGQFRLPEGFKPLRISASAIPDKKGRKAVRQSFVWQEAMAVDAAEES